jgi:hypothetical protein
MILVIYYYSIIRGNDIIDTLSIESDVLHIYISIHTPIHLIFY